MAREVCGTDRKRARREAFRASVDERAALLAEARAAASKAPRGQRKRVRAKLERSARALAWEGRKRRQRAADETCDTAREQMASEVDRIRKRRASASPAKKAAGRRAAEKLWERAQLQAVDVEKALLDDPDTADVAGLAAAEFRKRPFRWLREARKGNAAAWELFANHVREHIGDYRRKSVRKAEARTRDRLDAEARERLELELADEDAYERAEREAVNDEDLDVPEWEEVA